MKLLDNKKKLLIAFSTTLGMLFSAFLLYDQRGTLGQTEIFPLIITAIITFTIYFFITKKANQK